MKLITGILRGFQAIFAIVVLGISVDLARGQRIHSVPPATSYAAFCGGFGVLAALVGITAIFVSSLEGIVTWALDGLSSLTMLASGIAYVVLMRHTSCGNLYSAWENSLTNGGCEKYDGEWICGYGDNNPDKLKSRCVSARADTAFMFISFVTCLGVVAYTFFARKRSGGVSYA